MHDEQIADANNNNNQAVSSREQRLVEQVHKQLQNSCEPTPESLEQILLALPEKYQTMAIQVMAERFANSMKVHLLSIIAIFYREAANENIDAEDRDETLQDVEADVYDVMALNSQLAIDTLGDLFKLGKITESAQNLSQCDNAEEAQRWLYNLPAVYQGRLEREHLIREGASLVITSSTNARTE